MMGTTTPKDLSQQEQVIQYLQNVKKQQYRQPNEIQKKEFVEKYEKDFFHLLDSMKLLTDWNGWIKDISQKEVGNTINLNFRIDIPIEREHGELTLFCQHLFDKSKKDSDKIYQQVYAMSNGQYVTFDGFARTMKDESLDWRTINSLKISYPEIGFWVTDIVSGGAKDTISADLKKACMLVFDSVKLIEQSDSKQISKSEYNKQSDKLKKESDAVRELLTEEEKDYLLTLTNAAFYNYSYRNE